MKRLIALLIFGLPVLVVAAQPKLSSHPSARATIFLDFDGHYVTATSWNGGKSFYCEPAGLSDAMITEIFHRVAEDFRPFDLNITTDSTVFLAAPLSRRMRVIITPTSGWYTGVGGVAFTRSFTWGDDTPTFVFPDRLAWSPKIIAECCSHEAGHTLGLSHQAKYNEQCNLITVYNDGIGVGETGWAPVMGNSYYRNFSGWNHGPTPSGCMSEQDNLSIITGINGFGYRPDDHSDDPKDGGTVISIIDSAFHADGIITTTDDRDVFELNFSQSGILTLNARPFSVGPNNAGANLDVKVSVLDANYELIKVFDPQDKLDVSFEMGVAPTKYFVVLEGAANQYATNYGSLGAYSLSGSMIPFQPLPVTQLTLKATGRSGNHSLDWELVCDESIKSQELEVSSDGKNFRLLTAVATDARHFSYTPVASGTQYYRIKITTQTGSVSHSNIVDLKQESRVDNVRLASTTVRDQIHIHAEQSFNYVLTDMNGKILKRGNGTAGLNVIHIANSPDGIYIIQITSNSQRITHRVVKL